MHTDEEHNLKSPYERVTQRKEAKCPNPEMGLLPGEGRPGTWGRGAGPKGGKRKGDTGTNPVPGARRAS